MKKNTPLRKCIGCGTQKSKNEFLMVVRSPKRNPKKIFAVEHGSTKKEGRGAYLCANKVCLQKCLKSRRLERTFKCKIDSEIYSLLEKAVHNSE